MKKFLNGLVKVQYVNERYVVSGRELFKELKLEATNTKYADWIKKQLKDVDAIEEKDFFVLKRNTQGRPSMEHLLSLDIAKEICMVVGVAPRTNAETKALSKEIRKYFIECERYIDETRQRELFNQWRREESKKTNEFFDLLGDDNKCKRFSIAIYNLVSYLRALDHRYKKEDLYRMYRKGTDIESWVLYLEVEDNLITFAKTFMAIGREDYMTSAINLLHEYYIGDIDNYKEYIKTHQVYR